MARKKQKDPPPVPSKARHEAPEADRLNIVDLIDNRDNAARRIRLVAKVLRFGDPFNDLQDADYGTLSEYLDWVADELKPAAGGAE